MKILTPLNVILASMGVILVKTEKFPLRYILIAVCVAYVLIKFYVRLVLRIWPEKKLMLKK